MEMTVGINVAPSVANPITPVLEHRHTNKSVTKTNKRTEKLVYLVTFNFFLRKGKAMLPRIPMTAEIATRPPSTDSRTHCWSAYPYVTESKT